MMLMILGLVYLILFVVSFLYRLGLVEVIRCWNYWKVNSMLVW